MLRGLTVLCAVALQACDYVHGVRRSIALPEGCNPEAIESAVGSHRLVPSADRGVWNGEMWLLVRDGDANAELQCWRGRLYIGSAWINRDPERAVLEHSIRLQSELIDLLRARLSWVPPMDGWVVEWRNLQAPPAARDDDEGER